MNEYDTTKLEEQINTELTATRYALQSIEDAVENSNKNSSYSVVEYLIASPSIDGFLDSTGAQKIYSGKMDNFAVRRGAANRISAMLIGTVYEILTQEDCKYWNKHSLYEIPEMVFLQQVRHGVFHGNKFKLDSYDGGAKWKGVEITEQMENSIVFTEIAWDDSLFIPDHELPEGYGHSVEVVNEGLLEAGDGLALTQTAIDILGECH
jgi:hypothetical protein